MPGFNLGALNLCLTLKFGVCIENYVQLDKVKKKIQKNFENDREIEFLKFFLKILVITKMSAIRPKFNILSSSFFANILISIVLIDSSKKTLGYRGSCGVTFENLEFFRFLRAQTGGSPKEFQKKNSLKTV